MNCINKFNLICVKIMTTIQDLFDWVAFKEAHTKARCPIMDLYYNVAITGTIVNTVIK